MKFDRITDLMDWSVETTVFDFSGEKVEQPISAEDGLPVEVQSKPPVEKGIVPEPIFKELGA